VAYGANVGSNHTGKLPDQEIRPGEGVFYGLATAIKYPCNMDAAPYSLVASGAMTLAHRVDMPFSLVNQAGPGVWTVPALSPAFCEIMPGWCLYDNAYAVYRNEAKFRQRAVALMTAARDSGGDAEGYAVPAMPVRLLDHRILDRPDIVDGLLRARDALAAAKPPKWQLGKGRLEAAVDGGKGGSAGLPGTALYLDTEVEGIGKCYLTEASRQKGMRAYGHYARLYVLRAVHALATGGSVDDAPVALDHVVAVGLREGVVTDPAVAEWLRLRSGAPAATAAAPIPPAVVGLCEAYAAAAAAEAKAAATSKGRDSERGRKVHADYDAVHDPVADDAVIVWLRRRAADAAAAVERLKAARQV
jgi:hypothetical protein